MQPVRPNISNMIGTGCLLLFGIVWTAFAGLFFFMSFVSGAGWPFVLFAGAFVAVGLGIMGVGSWRLLIRPSLVGRHFARPMASIEPSVVQVGSRIRVRYEQTVRANVETRRFAMQLILRERATYQRGTNSYTVVHDGIIDSYEQPGRQLVAGEVISEDRTFAIPRDSMHSFDARNNKLIWLIRVMIDTPNAPDVLEEIEFVVAPMVDSEATA